MILNNLMLVVEADDLQRIFSRITGDVDKIRDLGVDFLSDKIVISGKISVGLSIPFKTIWQARMMHEGRSVALTLAGVSVAMVGMGEEMISSQLFSILAAKLKEYEFVRAEGKEIIVDLEPALKAQGITLNTKLKRLEITPSGIILDA